MNCVIRAIKVAHQLGPGHTIIKILCDNGMRHVSKLYNAQNLAQ